MSWRSTKLKRKVGSTLAGETLALSSALSEIEWLQIMYRDAVFGDVDVEDWRRSTWPFSTVLRAHCALDARQPHASLVDAKSIFDVLQKEAMGSRADRRTAIELAIVAQTLQRAGASHPRWVPHSRMPSGPLTKEDCTRVNRALEHMLRSGTFALIEESAEVEARRQSPGRKTRTQAGSLREFARATEEAQINETGGNCVCEASATTTYVYPVLS